MTIGALSSAPSGSFDFAQIRQQRFQQSDTDGDGKISLAELEQARPAGAPEGAPEASEIFAQLDSNEDGYIELSEADQGAAGIASLFGGGQAPAIEDATLSALLELLGDVSNNPPSERASSSGGSTSDPLDQLLELLQAQSEDQQTATDAYGGSQSLLTAAQPSLLDVV